MPALALALVAWERHVAAAGGTPLLTLELFALRPFRLGVTLSLLFYIGVPGLFLVISLYLQDGLGLSPIHAGHRLPARGRRVRGHLAGRRAPVDRRPRAGAGAGDARRRPRRGGHRGAVRDQRGAPDALALAPLFALVGAGNGFVIPGLNGTVLATTAPEQAGSASGLLVTAQQIGGAIGVAVAGTLYFGQADHADGLAAGATFVAALSIVTVTLAALLTAAARPRIRRSGRDGGPRARRWPARADTR